MPLTFVTETGYLLEFITLPGAGCARANDGSEQKYVLLISRTRALTYDSIGYTDQLRCSLAKCFSIHLLNILLQIFGILSSTYKGCVGGLVCNAHAMFHWERMAPHRDPSAIKFYLLNKRMNWPPTWEAGHLRLRHLTSQIKSLSWSRSRDHSRQRWSRRPPDQSDHSFFFSRHRIRNIVLFLH